jgi:hypothetical protein
MYKTLAMPVLHPQRSSDLGRANFVGTRFRAPAGQIAAKPQAAGLSNLHWRKGTFADTGQRIKFRILQTAAAACRIRMIMSTREPATCDVCGGEQCPPTCPVSG